MAKPRRIHWSSQLTGPDRAMARKPAISTQLIGLRRRYTSQSAPAKTSVTNSIRTSERAVNSGRTRTSGVSFGCRGGSSGTPTGGVFQAALTISSFGVGSRPRAGALHRAEKLRAQARDAEDAGTDVGADDRADLREQLRVAPVDVAPALGQALGLARRLDVLDGERVAAVLPARLEVRDQPLERAPGGAHPLDGLHLALDRQDRLYPPPR